MLEILRAVVSKLGPSVGKSGDAIVAVIDKEKMTFAHINKDKKDFKAEFTTTNPLLSKGVNEGQFSFADLKSLDSLLKEFDTCEVVIDKGQVESLDFTGPNGLTANYVARYNPVLKYKLITEDLFKNFTNTMDLGDSSNENLQKIKDFTHLVDGLESTVKIKVFEADGKSYLGFSAGHKYSAVVNIPITEYVKGSPGVIDIPDSGVRFETSSLLPVLKAVSKEKESTIKLLSDFSGGYDSDSAIYILQIKTFSDLGVYTHIIGGRK